MADQSASLPAVTEMDVAFSPEAPAVTEMDLALNQEVAAIEGQVAVENEAEAMMPAEEKEEQETGRKRKWDTVDVGDDDIMDTDDNGEGGSDEEEEAVLPVVPAVPQAMMQVEVEPPLQESPLQRLVDECRVLLAGRSQHSVPPSPLTVSRIIALFNGISPDDIRLDRDFNISRVMKAAAFLHPMTVIGAKYIYDCEDFTVAIFYLPAGTVMPLHDHPGMTVFSKLIAGTAHVESFDWVSPAIYGPGKHCMYSHHYIYTSLIPSLPVFFSAASTMRLAKRVRDHDVSAEEHRTWVLYPSTGGNLHRFIAARDEPCAFLDVLTPPYSTGNHRQCTFYDDYSFNLHRNHEYGRKMSTRKKRGLIWMKPVSADIPRDARIVPMKYNGPPVV
uniref:cysteine dioxygenase n=1 Tax=Leersia perrieri TaxID=77586 RepID=A0A0D9VX12_9ORYZ